MAVVIIKKFVPFRISGDSQIASSHTFKAVSYTHLSGRVSFDEITISDAFSDLDKVTTASLTSILKKAEKYAPLSI